MKSLLSFLTLMLLLTLGGMMTASAQKTQQQFGQERAVNVPYKLAADFARELSGEVIAAGYENSPDVSSRLQASLVHLDKDQVSELLVMDKSGFGIGTFWLFVKDGEGWKQIFKTKTHNLDIADTFSNAHRDIKIFSTSANVAHTTSYKFDGAKYKIDKCWSGKSGATSSKMKSVPCGLGL
jgi:hypothetical protein